MSVSAGDEDGSKRTRLANERTLLAWWRTGFTLLAVAVAVGRVVPEIADESAWPYEIIGAGFGAAGILFIWFGRQRQRAVDEALERGEYASMGDGWTFLFTLIGTVLGLATIGVIFAAH
jgi:uncharacterized membrane protein YidH (DUF202 family)